MKYIAFCLLLVSTAALLSGPVLAQAPAAVAVNTQVADGEAQVGDILSVSENGLVRSAVSYDPKMIGVIVEAPIVSVEPRSEGTSAVASSGTAQVRVSSAGGPIAVGDFITSSETAGVGKKATESGYVLGKALGALEGDGGLVSVSLEIGDRQIGTGGGGFFSSLISDNGRLRLVLSALLGIVVLIVGTFSFLRVVNTGVRAIGRNPLARGTIIRGMVISGAVVVVFVALGLGVSVAIIMLGGGQ